MATNIGQNGIEPKRNKCPESKNTHKCHPGGQPKVKLLRNALRLPNLIRRTSDQSVRPINFCMLCVLSCFDVINSISLFQLQVY